jgi:hypothetical protein
MIHWSTSLAFLLVATLAPAAASAQLEHKGAVSLSAERLFGLSHSTVSSKAGGQEASVSRTDFGLFIPSSSTFATLPRLAIDVAITDGLTLGGALGVIIVDSSVENSSPLANTTSSVSGTGFLVSPRIGWAMALGRVTRLWLRGGISYFRVSNKSDNIDLTEDGFSADLEPALVAMVGEHLGLAVTGLADLPLTGDLTVKTTVGGSNSASVDFKTLTLGVVLGLTFTF